jgi:hypothetical protein
MNARKIVALGDFQLYTRPGIELERQCHRLPNSWDAGTQLYYHDQ